MKNKYFFDVEMCDPSTKLKKFELKLEIESDDWHSAWEECVKQSQELHGPLLVRNNLNHSVKNKKERKAKRK